MSQKATRKSAVSEEKDKRTDSPVKEMKKKMAANAEKEKQADKATEKPLEKPEKSEKAKTSDKSEKTTEKVDKDKGSDKKAEKNGGVSEKVEKKAESKQVDKKEAQEKKEEKADKNAKPEKEKKEKEKPKQNGHNGVEKEAVNGNGGSTVSSEDEVLLVIDEQHDDEMFPELAYDDSDVEFEPGAPDGPSRSHTRRSQVKAARTPETPRPASDKQDKDNNTDDSKVLKLKEDTPASTDRKLRSADSPKPESKKEAQKEQEKDKQDKDKQDKDKQDKDKQEKDSQVVEENGEKDKVEVEIIVEVETEESRKPDTNYSKSRVKVSPYRRSTRLADQTTSSVTANYTGNNTTMEMDITETSIQSPSMSEDSSYLDTIRSMRGRRSYKKLGELSFKHTVRSTPTTSIAEHTSRPTGTVVGRKRKPDADESIELATEAGFDFTETSASSKRIRLLDRIAQPFRRTVISTQLPARRAAEIVGINTDLPLTAPVSSPDTLDPECLKLAPAVPAVPVPPSDRDKRCIVM